VVVRLLDLIRLPNGYPSRPRTAPLQELARKFAATEIIPRTKQLDQQQEYPHDIFKKAWETGLVNTHIPPAYGGPGLGSLAGVLIAEELAYGDAGVMTAIEINTVAEVPVMLAGTEEQKQSYLGRMIREPLHAAYCVTEPGAFTRALIECAVTIDGV
jgi:acyl-CoA dehydrogenase